MKASSDWTPLLRSDKMVELFKALSQYIFWGGAGEGEERVEWSMKARSQVRLLIFFYLRDVNCILSIRITTPPASNLALLFLNTKKIYPITLSSFLHAFNIYFLSGRFARQNCFESLVMRTKTQHPIFVDLLESSRIIKKNFFVKNMIMNLCGIKWWVSS